MYDELIKKLRYCGNAVTCLHCPYWEGCGGSKEDLTQAADAIEDLIAALTASNEVIAKRKPQWIPVTERLPEVGKDVLVMVHWRDDPEDMMCYGRKFKTRWYLWNGELGEILKGFDITHWMPLPEPPMESEA